MEPELVTATREEEVGDMSELSAASNNPSPPPPEAPQQPDAALLQRKLSVGHGDDTSSSIDADFTAEGPMNSSLSDSRELSMTSRKYDVGKKGYLTAAEQHMRDIDRSQRGYLTNEQVANVVEQTMEIQEHNVKLRNLVLGLFAAVLVLGVTNLALAFAAARLAKDTEVNGESGVLYVKGSSSTVVVTQSLGTKVTTIVHAANEASPNPFVCLTGAQLADLYVQNSMDGVDAAIVLEANPGTDAEEVETVGLSRTSAFFNETHVVFKDLVRNRELAFDLTSNACDTVTPRQRREQRQRTLLRNGGNDNEEEEDDEELARRRRQLRATFPQYLQDRLRRRRLCVNPLLCGGGESSGSGFSLGDPPQEQAVAAFPAACPP